MSSKLIGTAVLLAAVSMPTLASDIDDVYFQVRPSFVQLVGIGVDGRYSLGSGVALPDGNIVKIPWGAPAEGREVIGAGSLHFPTGVAYLNGALYVSNSYGSGYDSTSRVDRHQLSVIVITGGRLPIQARHLLAR